MTWTRWPFVQHWRDSPKTRPRIVPGFAIDSSHHPSSFAGLHDLNHLLLYLNSGHSECRPLLPKKAWKERPTLRRWFICPLERRAHISCAPRPNLELCSLFLPISCVLRCNLSVSIMTTPDPFFAVIAIFGAPILLLLTAFVLTKHHVDPH